MRHVTKTLLVPMLLGLLASCGQEAEMSGDSRTARTSRRTLEETPSADATATPTAPGAGAQATASGSAGVAVDTARSFIPGDDTEGDLEPPDTRPPPTPGEEPLPELPDPIPDDGNKPKRVREMVFPADKRIEGALTRPLDAADLTQELTLRATEVERSLQVTQEARPRALDEHTQGPGPTPVTESFQGTSSRILDVLLVLDNGGNMREEARNMAAKLAPLIGLIDATDWQIGVVTTDPAQTCLRALIKKGDTDVAGALAGAVTVGTQGSNNPRALLQAVRSLSGECLTAPWIRAQSSVEVLVVSDQDNCMNGNGCQGKDYAQGRYLRDYLATIRTVGSNAHFHGVFMPPSTQECDCPTATNRGNIYHALVQSTGGAWGSICEENYTPALNAITSNVSVAMRKTFTLAREPGAGTMRVEIDGVEVTSGFTLQGRVLTLATALGENGTLKVTYSDGAAPLLARFPLRFAPLAATVRVQVNGVMLEAAAFTVDAAMPAVVLAATPAAGARIVIDYVRDVPLATRFVLGAPVLDAARVKVAVDGVATTDFTVDAAAGVVTLGTAPAEGAVISFLWPAAGAPILRYPVAIPETSAASLMVVDAATGVAVPVTYANGFVEIAAADFVAGRRLLLRYPNPARDEFMVELPVEPLPGSVVATAGGVSCSMAPALVVTGKVVSFDGCPFPRDAAEVRVTYAYLESITRFVFDAPDLPAPGDYQMWTVWVNDVETMEYTRDGNAFTFPAALPVGAMVRIRLEQVATSRVKALAED